MIKVRLFEHRAWHILFDNHSVSKVFKKINWYWVRFGRELSELSSFDKPFRPSRLEVAWFDLFGNKNLEEVFEQVNSTWIDRRFKFEIINDEPQLTCHEQLVKDEVRGAYVHPFYF